MTTKQENELSELDTPEYQAFVEEMAKDCSCLPPWDCPCAGVLAGGICDKMGHTIEADEADPTFRDEECEP